MGKRFDNPEWRMPIIFVLMVIVLAVASNGIFLQPNNIINLFAQNAIIGVITIGQFLVILSGGIDLSAGSMLALTTLIIVHFQDFGLIPSIIIALIVGSFLGLINGLLVTKLKIMPFMATLVTMGVYRGLAFVMVRGHIQYHINDAILNINRVRVFNVPLIVYVWLSLVIIWIIILKYTRYGVCLYSTGGNEKAAKLSGIQAERTKLMTYTFMGTMCGVAALLYVGRLALAEPGAGETFALDSITAVVIGGALLAGGVGKLSNAILGVLIFGMLNNFMNLVGIPSAMHVGIRGFILVLTVYLNSSNLLERMSIKHANLRAKQRQ